MKILKALKTLSAAKHEICIRKWATLKMAAMRPYASSPEEDHCRSASWSTLQSGSTASVKISTGGTACINLHNRSDFMKELKGNETVRKVISPETALALSRDGSMNTAVCCVSSGSEKTTCRLESEGLKSFSQS